MKKHIPTFLLAAATLLTEIGSVTSKGIGCDNSFYPVHDSTECPVETESGYEGPAPFEAIFAGNPTTPVEYSDSLADTAKGMATNLISGALGAIPKVGGVMSFLFDKITEFFPGGPTWETAIEQLYSDLHQEVENLKLYVNQEVLELEIRIVKQYLGGIYRSVDYCQSFIAAADVVTCLKSVMSDILILWSFFMPSIPYGDVHYSHTFPTVHECLLTSAKLENILPMFRQYADILIYVRMELISSLRHDGDDAQAEVFAADLITEIDSIVDYYERAFKIIQCNSVTLKDEGGKACSYHTGTGCCVTDQTYHQSEVHAMFGPSGSSFECSTGYRVGCKHQGSSQLSVQEAFLEIYFVHHPEFQKLRYAAVRNYYNTQFEHSVDDWIAIRDRLSPQISQKSLATAKAARRRRAHNDVPNADSGLVRNITMVEPGAHVQGVTKRKGCTDYPRAGQYMYYCDETHSYCVKEGH